MGAFRRKPVNQGEPIASALRAKHQLSASLTDIGRQMSKNEDAILNVEYSKEHAAGGLHVRRLMAVADGIGGGLAGDMSSRQVIDTIRFSLDPIMSKPWNFSSEEETRQYVFSSIKAAFREGQVAVEEVAKKLNLGIKHGFTGTTLALGIMDGMMLYVGHCGDSSAYVISKDGIRLLTPPHENQSGKLVKALTSIQDFKYAPDLISVRLNDGDIVAFCTDGFENCGLTPFHLAKALRRNSEDLQRGCAELVELANKNGGVDNLSIIVSRPTQ